MVGEILAGGEERRDDGAKAPQSLEGDKSRKACTFSLARCPATREIGALRGLRVGAPHAGTGQFDAFRNL